MPSLLFKRRASSPPDPSPTAHPATYHRLGQPGPASWHVWLCLHDHGQSVTDLADQLANLNTPERLLILPVAPATPGPGRWFRPGSTGPDLAQVRAFLDQLTEHILVACPARP